MKPYDKVIEACNAKIPRDVIYTRKGGSGQEFSYLTGHYIIERLNEVLGQGNWAYSSETFLLHSGEYKKKDFKGNEVSYHSVHYSARVRLVVTVGDKPTEFTEYGCGEGTDPLNPGKAHELAMKGAITDGLKRAARCLGNSFGNGLYDKSGDGIEESPPEVKAGSQRVLPTPKANGVDGVLSQPKEALPQAPFNREPALKLISQYSKIAIDKRLLTQDQALGMVKEYRVDRKEDLTDSQVTELLAKMKAIVT